MAYNEIHGVEAAVAHYADRVCDKLNQKEKEQARLIFIQLVHLGEETGDTRRLATRVEVGEENWDLVTRLADARLVVTGYDEATGNETVEIVHEALIQKWGHLRQWLELDRDFRTWLQELRAARQQWEKSNRDKDALLRGKALADAQQWLQKRPDELTLEQEYQGHRERVVDVSFSPDGKTIATASDDRTAKIWKLDGTLCVTLEGHEDEVNGISFSPDGRTIATASDDKTVKLWKLDDTLCQTPNRTINAYKTLIGHEERIISVKFSPNGKQIASASFDKTIKLWKQDGRLLRTFQGHDDWVWSVDFSSDGQKLASASYDTTIRFWNLGNIETEILDLDDWLKKGCSQVRDYLKNSSKVIESDKHLCDGIGS